MGAQSSMQNKFKKGAKKQGHKLGDWKDIGHEGAKIAKCTACKRTVTVYPDGLTQCSLSGGSLQDPCPK